MAPEAETAKESLDLGESVPAEEIHDLGESVPLPVPSFQNLPEPPGSEDSPERPDVPQADVDAGEVVVDDPAEPPPETSTDEDPNLV